LEMLGVSPHRQKSLAPGRIALAAAVAAVAAVSGRTSPQNFSTNFCSFGFAFRWEQFIKFVNSVNRFSKRV